MDRNTKPSDEQDPGEGRTVLNLFKVAALFIILAAFWFFFDWLLGRMIP